MALPSLLCQSSLSLRIFRFFLISLGVLLLVLDIVSTVSREENAAWVRTLKRPVPEPSKDYAVRFLPDLLMMALYTLFLVLVYRSNRITAAPSATLATVSSPSSSMVWPTLRVLFTLFSSGFLMFAPFRTMHQVRVMVNSMKPLFISGTSSVDELPGFNEWYFCYPKPTFQDMQEAGEDLRWFWRGCVILRARDLIAISTAFLILIELVCSLREAYHKNNTEDHKELLDTVVDKECL